MLSHNKRTLSLFLVFLVLISGCSNMQTVAVENGSMPAGIEVGDTVTVQTLDGNTQTLTVTAIDNNGIRGGNVFVAYTDISELRVQRDGMSNSMVLVLGAIGVVALVAAVGGGGGGGGY